MRVVPTGVVDLETRLNDVVTRLEKYRIHPQKDKLLESSRNIEKQIQQETKTDLEDISDQTISDNLENLLILEF